MARKSLDDEEFGTTLANVFLIAAVALVGVLGLYFFQFHGPLSSEHPRWNEFGGFLGGTVGPLFSFLSLLVLLSSLAVQRRALNEARRQGVLQELQRLMSATAAEIDGALQAESLELWPATSQQIDNYVRSNAKRAPTVRDALHLIWEALYDGRLPHYGVFETAESTEAGEVFRSLVRLDACLVEFLARGGDPVIGVLYGQAYADAARTLVVASHLQVLVPLDVPYPLLACGRLGVVLRAADLERIAATFREQTEREHKAHEERKRQILEGRTPPT